MKKKGVVVLGATGSIGKSAVAVLKSHPERFRTVGLAARKNVELLARYGEELNAGWVISTDPRYNDKLTQLSPRTGRPEELCELICSDEVDVVLCAIVGTAGLPLVVAALKAGKTVALASKEVLVMAGDYIMDIVHSGYGNIVPVDSEHSAIFQCLATRERAEVERLILTASGGALRNASAEEIAGATLERTLAHPTWNMGRKVTIDSATLMNKALEFVEAGHLFGFPAEKITAVIHPQSIVHSMIEMIDGTVIAQLAMPDMRFAIGYGMSYPDRLPGRALPKMDFAALGGLEFSEVDNRRFPSLEFARQAFTVRGTMPAVMNAANEIAVERFIKGELNVPGIWRIVEQTMAAHQPCAVTSLEAAYQADAWARSFAADLK